MQLPITDPVQAAARTAWGEARGEGSRGMQAVLNVIANRVAHPGWWGRDIAGVCQSWKWDKNKTRKIYQYSCWNAEDTNKSKLLSVTPCDEQFKIALQLAQELLASRLPDLTMSSDSYYDWRTPTPKWAQGRFYKCTIGNHAFYRVGLIGDGK